MMFVQSILRLFAVAGKQKELYSALYSINMWTLRFWVPAGKQGMALMWGAQGAA